MQRVHNFLHGSIVIPPVDIENVNVRGSKLLQASFDAITERLGVITDEQRLLGNILISTLVICSILYEDTNHH